jgi:hypothetical protein
MLSALVACAVVNVASAGASEGIPAFDPMYPRPPYLMTNVDQYIVTVFEADRSAIEGLLPPGIRPAASNTVGVTHYIARQGSGIIPYEGTSVWVEVDGFDAPGGAKARWVLYGLYSPDRAVSAFREVHGFPLRYGATKVELNGKRWRGAALRDGKEVIVSEMSVKGEAPTAASGVAHYPVLRDDTTTSSGTAIAPALWVNRVPWSGQIHMAEPVSLRFNLPDEHPLRKLEPKKLLYAFHCKDLSFAIGYPMPLK